MIWIALHHHPAELGDGLDEDHPRHHRLAGEMPCEKCLVAPHLIDSIRLAPRHQRFQLIHKPERRTMRQRQQRRLEIGTHLHAHIILSLCDDN